LMDVFPNLSWQSLKKVVYISLFLIGPMNGLFLRELFPKYFHARLIDAMVIIGIAVSLFTLVVSPHISYSIVPAHHVYNVLIGLYLLVSVGRAAYQGEFGSRFLLVGYLAAFVTALHDILSSQYVIEGYSFSMIHVGMIFYIFQLIAVIAGRYIFALNGKEELSAHLKKVNSELEEMVVRRTKDLSKQKELVEQKNKELHKALVEKDHLMAVVAHDLKAPLSSIMGISDLMMSELKGQSAEFNKMIQKVTLDGRKLIENLTELKVYEQDDFEANLSTIDLKSFFQSKVLHFIDLAEKKEIELESNISDSATSFTFDESILSRIIDNLLSNAIKFTPKKGNVILEATLDGKDLEIRIKDNGPGFKDRDKKKLFQKFQRLSARPTGGESSTGLGLSIVKTLVEKIGGTIELSEETNEGAEFIIIIPSHNA
ncbi:MAG: sensor histidine kinase, partial [Bacteroidota bacterium]